MLQQASAPVPGIGVQFWRLTKPRVVSLIVFTAVIGMLLATPLLPPPGLLLAATIGIALVAGPPPPLHTPAPEPIRAPTGPPPGRPAGPLTPSQPPRLFL